MIDYSKVLSQRAVDLKPSGIRKFFDILDEMQGVISLTVGQPDFVTPWHIREAGIYSLEKGSTHYTANTGILELKNEICKYTKRRQNLDYDYKKQVIVTVGGSEAIDICIRAVVNPGDEVIIPEPSFVCYKPCTILAGGVPVVLKTKAENNFKITPEELEAAITPKTKLLILPYPNNPTGAIMTKEELEKLAEVLKGKNILILSDEIYGELSYDKPHVSIASINEEMYEKTIVVNGFSKAFAMTGWRLGYVLGNSELVSAMTKIHQYAIMCAPTTSQYAAVEAMRNGDDDVARMREEYNYRRKVALDMLDSIGLECFEPQGAFYLFPSIKSTGLTSEQFCEQLLHDQKVAVVPGNAFGESGEGFVRMSYCYSIDNLKTALERIGEFVNKCKNR